MMKTTKPRIKMFFYYLVSLIVVNLSWIFLPLTPPGFAQTDTCATYAVFDSGAIFLLGTYPNGIVVADINGDGN